MSTECTVQTFEKVPIDVTTVHIPQKCRESAFPINKAGLFRKERNYQRSRVFCLDVPIDDLCREPLPNGVILPTAIFNRVGNFVSEKHLDGAMDGSILTLLKGFFFFFFFLSLFF